MDSDFLARFLKIKNHTGFIHQKSGSLVEISSPKIRQLVCLLWDILQI